jgi:hypothetical protein
VNLRAGSFQQEKGDGGDRRGRHLNKEEKRT